MSVKKNIIANIIGSGWSALMSMLFIPVYIKYMGIDSYGLIGVFAILLNSLALIDMGMTPTLSREMARFSGNASSNKSILDLLRSIEVIVLIVAIIIIIIIFFSSKWLSQNWINNETLDNTVVINALIIMGFVAALKFIEGIYRSSIIGLQKQIQFNIMGAFFSTFRGIGAVVVLAFVSPTIGAFFTWQAVISIVTIVGFRIYLYSVLPKMKTKSSFSWAELNKIKNYAMGMMGITLLAFLLTQVDKMILVKMLSLSEYGYYTMAFLVSNILNMIVVPLSQAVFPKFVELKTREDSVALINLYHKSAQLITVSVGVLAGYLIFFSDTIIMIWTQDAELTKAVAPLVSVLSFGTFLNILMWMPYQMQLAYGWTSLAVKMNIIAIMFIIPAILLIVPIYGAIGSAWIWVAMNAGYTTMGVHFMYRKILIKEKWRWYFNDIIKPLTVCFGLIIFFKFIIQSENLYITTTLMILSMIIVSVATMFSASLIRVQVLNILKGKMYAHR